ncbi:hypothetical protein [Paracidovorax cattleyae]|uniref:Holin n=1 Tax=Paracidovorax cattleyae TaxID=80868 RepID=A0A1H0VRH5_9BURK|nr:hypothetical protein [Paracidovorax cattleyae]AVS74485.1 hypothetical protein C8240_11105 [Paracidovorax cattleyae]SDP81060.1 hypothetical protein SAMN04489708_12828 [Paracidovorax cattleyae]
MKLQYILGRMREPSTWAAISALGVVFGLPPGTVDLAVQVGVAATGILGVLLPDKGATAPKVAP